MTNLLNHLNTYADLTAYNGDMNKDFPNVSYIEATDEVKWNRYNPEYVVCIYNVSNTSEATKLLEVDTGITYQIIDGVQQDFVQTEYMFEASGEHTVEYKLDGTDIEDYVFQNCTDLTSVIISNSVKTIGESAFDNCEKLTSVAIPNSVTNIGDSAFRGCPVLTNIVIPDSVTYIADFVFDQCTGLRSISIGKGLTSISTGVFSGCSSLTYISIPDNITNIQNGAFRSCTGLINITVEATTPPTLSTRVFDDTNDCPISVPAESVNAYKTAANWSAYANRIQAIP